MRKSLSTIKTTFYRQPRNELQRLIRWGPRAYIRCDAWAHEMEEYAWNQLEVADRGLPKKRIRPKIYFMTGKGHWYQTAFCLATFLRHSQLQPIPVVLDDGSLTQEIITRLVELFPEIEFLRKDECDQIFIESFPVEAFPNLHRWRQRQLLFRKLTDIHAESGEMRTFFDSDMLFFATPTEIDNNLLNPAGCIFQTDCWESYGYSRALTERLCGHTIPGSINIGIFSLDGAKIDWERVESWVGEMEAKEGRRYNITQCTCAMLIAGQAHVRLPSDRYPVLPTSDQVDFSLPLHHYVSDAKPLYFRSAWRAAIRT